MSGPSLGPVGPRTPRGALSKSWGGLSKSWGGIVEILVDIVEIDQKLSKSTRKLSKPTTVETDQKTVETDQDCRKPTWAWGPTYPWEFWDAYLVQEPTPP